MAAEFREQFRHGLQRFQQMKRANAAARALRDSVFDAEHERGAMEAFDHSAGDDADDAAMPAFARENQRCIGVGNRLLDALLKDCIGNGLFRLLTILIQLVQLGGEGAGAIAVVGQKHFDDVGCARHPTGCVDARRDLKCDVAGAGHIAFCEAGDVENGSQADVANAAEAGEAELDDRAIFAGERDDVGDGRDRNQLEQRFDRVARACQLPSRMP